MSEPPRRAPKLLGLRAVLLVSAALLAITWYALPRWSPYSQTAVAASPRATTERGELTADSDLAEWHLSPDFTQGLNQVILSGDNIGTATKLEIVYHHRYSSY